MFRATIERYTCNAMPQRRTPHLALAVVMLFAAVVFLVGINWGLPSRKVDPFLFGDEPVWSGEKIAQLAGSRDSTVGRGADVDVNPLSARDRPVLLNATDQQRAEIIRRYRLFTYQPDEMITMMALASMRPGQGDFDPKLYQYGGLWIYPVGGLIKVLLHPRADQTYYLDHPEEFGRFYIVARLYVVAWALVGVWAVFWIARRLSGGDILVAAAAAVVFALMPVVVNMAHEAKPHLPGAVLILLGVIAATKYFDTGATRWALLTGALCGAATGMVLSASLSIVIPLAMTLLRRATSWNRRVAVTLASVACVFAVYFLTNPYVAIHLLGSHREVLTSNLSNSTAMYQAPASLGGAMNALRLVAVGATPPLAVVGAVVALSRARRAGATAWLLAIVSLTILVQFIALATNKPAEYARFALLPDIALGIAAVVAIGNSSRGQSLRVRVIPLAMVCLITGLWGVSYDWHFASDSIHRSTRRVVAERLRKAQLAGCQTLAIDAEPAPYSLPPVDLFKWKVVLTPAPDHQPPPDYHVHLRTTDDSTPPRSHEDTGARLWIRPRLLPTPISWAAKSYDVKFGPGAPTELLQEGESKPAR
jgi:hypothetical protein